MISSDASRMEGAAPKLLATGLAGSRNNTQAPGARPRGPDPSLRAYVDHLPLLDAEKHELLESADFTELHRRLGRSSTVPPAAPPLASLRRRLALALGGSANDLIHTDRAGHLRLSTTPPMRRATMAPRPLPGNPFARLWRRLRADGAAGHLEPRGVRAQREADALPQTPPPWRAAGIRRRVLFTVLVLGQTAAATWFALAVLPYHGGHWLEPPILAMNAILIGWVSAGFWMALMGFWVLARGGDRHAISARDTPDRALPRDARTAILIPIYNENVRRVFAGVRATYESLARTGQLGAFDFYLLSDSTDPDARAGELEAWAQLCREVKGFRRIFYRHRRLRIKRKSGNIADWCRRWGSHYRYMVVLDADSVMSGRCLTRLVQMMEANPGAGILQTVAMPTGRDTLYGRIQQFAQRVYAPLFSAGIHFWHLGEAYYWGHNAILRVAPFIRHCALPTLSRGPLGGEILSHDFVEAALMRRAGWHVWVVYDLPESWEEMPPTLLDELRRDRRWCQGNLQHTRLFMAQGLHPAHRALFMAGIMAYVSSLLWFLFLALCTALLAVHVLVPPTYFTQPFQLFPIWPEWRPQWAAGLFAATAALLVLPKLLSVALIALGDAAAYGGRVRLTLSVLLEIVFATLLAPIKMLFHARFVMAAVLGINVRWQSPPREDVETSWGEAIRQHGGGTLIGIAWAGYVGWLNPGFLWWLLPIAGSMIAAIPLSVWSSRVRGGLASRAASLFLTPEETAPPSELARLAQLMSGPSALADGFRRACADPLVNALVCGGGARLQARAEPRQLVEHALASGPEPLGPAPRNALLRDRLALSALHHGIWSEPGKLRAQWMPSPNSSPG